MDEVDGAEDADDFERLRSIRDQRRREKYLQKLMARSVSAQQVWETLCYDIFTMYFTHIILSFNRQPTR